MEISRFQNNSRQARIQGKCCHFPAKICELEQTRQRASVTHVSCGHDSSQDDTRILFQTFLLKIASNGRCGHLSDREDREFCDGETREHVQTTSAKNFVILSPSSAPKISCSYRLCRSISWYYHINFQIKRINTLGCESIRKFRKARPNSAHWVKPENPTPSDCAD